MMAASGVPVAWGKELQRSLHTQLGLLQRLPAASCHGCQHSATGCFTCCQELEQLREAEEAEREEQRLQAEQARLAAQFENEQAKEKAKASQAADVGEAVAGAWNAAKQAAVLGRNRGRDHGRSRGEWGVTKARQRHWIGPFVSGSSRSLC